MNAFDLYAKIEPLIGFYDEYDNLYSSYLQLLLPLHVETVLDIGCGNGKLLKLLEKNNFKAFGIDRSVKMINRAKKLGVNASTKELSKIKNNSFDCALAVADVLNYIKPDELNIFFEELSIVLKDEGYFLADVNTIEGFELADGVMVRDEEDKFLSVESFFDKKLLTTNITFFGKKGKVFKKSNGEILQYYHPENTFKNLKTFKLVARYPISLFSDEKEKSLMVFQKKGKINGR